MAFLRFNRQGRDWAGFKALQADWLSRFLAITICAIFDPDESLIDLADQFPCPVPCAQFKCTICFDTGSIGHIGFVNASFGKAGQGSIGFTQKFALPLEQFLPEIFHLKRIHELFRA